MAYIAKYLLAIEEFMDTEKGEALMERAFLRVDEARREKAERMKTPAGRAACLGAGLLLRYAVAEALRDGSGRFWGRQCRRALRQAKGLFCHGTP